MIFKLADMIGSKSVSTPIVINNKSVWVRAVPLPFNAGFIGRLGAAWAVLTEKAYAVKWPEPGELEKAYHAE